MNIQLYVLRRKNTQRLLVALLGFLLLFFLSVSFAPKKVTVFLDGDMTQHYTYKGNIQEVIAELGISLREEDKISMSLADKVKRNSVLEIEKATKYTVFHDGTKSVVYHTEADIKAILQSAEIEVSELDIIDNTELKELGEIRITRVVEDILVENSRIYFQEKRIANSSMFRGQSRTVQQGNEGVIEKSYLIVYHDGEKVKEELMEEKIIEEKQDRIIEYGTIETISKDGRDLLVRTRMNVTATAYCSGLKGTGCPVDSRGWAVCTGQYANGYTSIGLKANPGDGTRENPHIVAVDPKKIPLRSLLYIEGLGFAYAADVGSAITGNRIDILMPTHQQAWWFGRRSMTVYVIEKEL